MKYAFVFPGQGSQYVGMGKSLRQASSAARDVFAEADEALARPISQLIFEGPEEELRLTWNTQPAILTVSVACLRALQEGAGLSAWAGAGHSLGEYSALVAAGSLAFPDAVRVVEQRGRFMQEAVPVGAGGMAAVLGLETEVVAEICTRLSVGGRVVELANDNSPGQVVISGHVAALEEATLRLKEAGAKRVVPLAVSAPFHCSLMRPAGERLGEVLAAVAVEAPAYPVTANADGGFHGSAGEVRENLVRQVSQPVRWQDCVRTLAESGCETFLEIGPGKVLSGLIRRIVPDRAVGNIEDLPGIEAVAGR